LIGLIGAVRSTQQWFESDAEERANGGWRYASDNGGDRDSRVDRRQQESRLEDEQERERRTAAGGARARLLALENLVELDRALLSADTEALRSHLLQVAIHRLRSPAGERSHQISLVSPPFFLLVHSGRSRYRPWGA
jgi:hypothetical protein